MNNGAVKVRHYMREWREKKDLTQEQVAKALGTHRGMVSRYENSKRGLSVTKLFQVSRAIGITPAQCLQHPDEASILELLQTAGPNRRKEFLAALQKLLDRE